MTKKFYSLGEVWRLQAFASDRETDIQLFCDKF